MIFRPKGWVSIAGLHKRFASTVTFWWDADTLRSRSYEEADQMGLFAAWECLETMPSVATLSPTGEIIPLALSTLASAGWIEQKTNTHFHLDYGSLGSGHGGILEDGGNIDAPMPTEIAQLRYGPFAFCPVLIPKASFDDFEAEHSDQLQQENGYGPPSNKQTSVVGQIFEVIDSGRAIRRDDIKRIVAVNMKVDEWRAYWREAVIIRPELGRSGPKPKSN